MPKPAAKRPEHAPKRFSDRAEDRLDPSRKPPPPKSPARLEADFFIEESSKTATTVLEKADNLERLTRPRAGDRASLSIDGRKLVVRNQRAEQLGTVEPRLAARLMRLMRRGNSYEAGVLSSSRGRVVVLIREARQAPALSGTPSFPSTVPLHEIDAGPFEKRELGIEASDLEGYREAYEENEPEAPRLRPPVVSKQDELLADETDEEKSADAEATPEEEEQFARDRELVAEEEDLEPEV